MDGTGYSGHLTRTDLGPYPPCSPIDHLTGHGGRRKRQPDRRLARWPQQLHRPGCPLERQRLADAQSRGGRSRRCGEYVFRNGASFVADSLPRRPAGRRVAGTQIPTNVAEFVSGTTWTTLGMAPNNEILSYSVNGPVVRVNGTGDIFLAWLFPQAVGGNGTDRVSGSRFDGTTWQTLGGPLVSGYQARDYDMTIDNSGAPIVADSELLSENGGISCSLIAGTAPPGRRPHLVWPPPVQSCRRMFTRRRSQSTAADAWSRPGCISTTCPLPPRSPSPATSPDRQAMA